MSAWFHFDEIAADWWRWMCGAALDGAIGVAVALIAWVLLHKQMGARLGCVLFMLVLVKMAVPLPVTFTAWQPEALPAASEHEPMVFAAMFADEAAEPSSSASFVIEASGLNWQEAILLVWSAVVIVGLALLAWRLSRTWRLVREASPSADARTTGMIAALTRVAGCRRTVLVLESSRLSSPAAWGFGAARILLPVGLAAHLTDAQLRWTLAHGLAHLRRHDAWWSLLQSGLLVLFCWHPTSWIASRMIDRLREEACDADATALSQAPPSEAASGLLAIIEWASLRPAQSFAMPGMVSQTKLIKHRIMKIASHPVVITRARALISAAVAALAILPSIRPDWSLAAENEKVKQLEKRVAELEGEKSREARLADLRAKNKQKAGERGRQDTKTYDREQLQEIETLYQVANKNWRTLEAKESLIKLLEKYDNANRTGCATLYMGQMSEGPDRADYLKRAVEKFSDCFYYDGCQVGGYARYILGAEAHAAGRKDEAEKWFAEIKKDYAEAIMHNGTPVTEAVDKFLASQTEKK